MENAEKMYKRVITFGAFDVFHEGHYNFLKRAKAMGEYLIVGVSSDALNVAKGKSTQWDLAKRLETLKKCEFVDECFVEESLAEKQNYINHYQTDVLVMGDNWEGAFDWVGIPCVYLPRTKNVPSVSAKIAYTTAKKSYAFLLYNMGLGKTQYREGYQILTHYFNEYNIRHFEYHQDYALLTDAVLDAIDAVIMFNPVVEVADLDFEKKLGHKPKILIDYGAICTKWFLSHVDRYKAIDYFLVAGKAHKHAMESFFGVDDTIIATGFIKSQWLRKASTIARAGLCDTYNLDKNKPIVLYAPARFDVTNQAIVFAHNLVLEQLHQHGNYLVALHPENTMECQLESLQLIKDMSRSEVMKLCDVIVSDNSSVLCEALVTHKKTLQILMPAYADNPSTGYCYPWIAGTGDNFVAGVPAYPYELCAKIATLDAVPDLVYETLRYNMRMGTYMCEDAHEKIISELLRICDTPFVRKAKNITVKNLDGYVNRLYITAIKDRQNIMATVQTAIKNDFKYIQLELSWLTPELLDILKQHKDIFYILKIDAVDKKYFSALDSLRQYKSHWSNLMVQVYSLSQYQYLESIGFSQCVFVLKEYFNEHPFAKEVIDSIKYMVQGKVPLAGIVLQHLHPVSLESNLENPLLYALQAFGKPIYIDGVEVGCNTIASILAKSCGVYCDEKSATVFTDQKAAEHAYVVYKTFLNRMPDGKALAHIVQSKAALRDDLYLLRLIKTSEEYLNVSKTYDENQNYNPAKIFAYLHTAPKVYDIYTLMEYILSLASQNIFPTRLVMLNYQPIVLNSIAKPGSPFDIYKVIKQEYLAWSLFERLFLQGKAEIEKIAKHFFNLILQRDYNQDELKLCMEDDLYLASLTKYHAYQRRLHLADRQFLLDPWSERYNILIGNQNEIAVIDLSTNAARWVRAHEGVAAPSRKRAKKHVMA